MRTQFGNFGFSAEAIEQAKGMEREEWTKQFPYEIPSEILDEIEFKKAEKKPKEEKK